MMDTGLSRLKAPLTEHDSARALLAITALALATLLWLLSAAGVAHAGHEDDETLGGRPFTDPSDIVPMPDSWRKAPITHKTPKPVDLAVSLDQQLYPALLPIIRDFAKTRGKEIAVQEGTCGISGGVLAEKTADIGGFCCPPAVTDRLPGLKYHTLGIGSLALIVHPNNPRDDVSLKQAQDLFGGHATRWADLPMSGIKAAADRDVRAVARLHCKQRPGHWRLILDDENLFGRDIQEVSAITDMILQVGRMESAIGYETLWHIVRHVNQQKVKLLRVNGVDPRDDAALASGSYPLYRVFNITTWADTPAAKPLADDLASYLIEKAGAIAPEFGILPVQKLRAEGWKFFENELIGMPK